MNRISMISIAFGMAAALTGCAGMRQDATSTKPAAPTLADIAASRAPAYRDMNAALQRINAELKQPTPQLVRLQSDAALVNDFAARQQYILYPGGSGPETGVATSAKPEIWNQPAQFKAAQDLFKTRAQGLVDAVSTNNPATIRTQIQMLGQACGGCHNPFRVPPPPPPAA